MKRNLVLLIVIAVWIIAGSVAVIASNSSYGKLQLKAFNELNGTHYTIKQWRVYRYDIEKLHPFIGQE